MLFPEARHREFLLAMSGFRHTLNAVQAQEHQIFASVHGVFVTVPDWNATGFLWKDLCI